MSSPTQHLRTILSCSSATSLLPEVTEIGDPVLASIWSPDLETGAAAFVGSSKSHIVTVDRTPYVFIYRDISGYSDQPWVVGRYLPLDETWQRSPQT